MHVAASSFRFWSLNSAETYKAVIGGSGECQIFGDWSGGSDGGGGGSGGGGGLIGVVGLSMKGRKEVRVDASSG